MSEPSRIRINRPMWAVAAASVTCAALASCETPPKAATNEPAKVSRTASEPLEGSEPPSELAKMAQRDVEALLNWRQDGLDRPKSPEPPPRNEPPEIIWNQPTGGRAHPPLPTPTGADAPPPVLATEANTLDPDRPRLTPDQPPADLSALDAAFRGRLGELLVDLSKELYQEASYADMPLRELLLIAATTLVSPDRALVPDAIPGLTVRERELLAHFQSFFIELGRKLDGSRNADEVLINGIESLRASLTTEPRLELGALALCTRVGGFGDYTTFSKNSFLAHSEQRAIVYIEIGGFTSELNPKGEWVTELSQQLVIYSERDGMPVWREDWQSAVDASRNKRNDFFVVQIITLPQALSVGKYHLKVRVRDEKSKAEAEGAIPFEMVADQRLATDR